MLKTIILLMSFNALAQDIMVSEEEFQQAENDGIVALSQKKSEIINGQVPGIIVTGDLVVIDTLLHPRAKKLYDALAEMLFSHNARNFGNVQLIDFGLYFDDETLVVNASVNPPAEVDTYWIDFVASDLTDENPATENSCMTRCDLDRLSCTFWAANAMFLCTLNCSLRITPDPDCLPDCREDLQSMKATCRMRYINCRSNCMSACL